MSLPRSQNYVGAEHGAFVSVCRVRKTWLLFSDSHIGRGWLHSASGTQLASGLRSRTVYVESAGNCRHDVFCEILEDARTHQPLFKISCRMHSSDLRVDVVVYSASTAVKEFTERLTGASLRNKSSPEFFEFAQKSVQRQLQAEALRDSDISGNTDYAATDADCAQASRTGSGSGREKQQQKMSFQLLKAGEILSKDGWAEHEVCSLVLCL